MKNATGPFCPNCGAQNPISAAFCGSCGETLPRREDLASLWGETPDAATSAGGSDRSLDDTQVIATSSAPQSWSVRPSPARPANDSWEIKAAKPAPAAPWRPGGFLLGFVALLLVCVVLGVFGWFAGRPIVQDQVQSQVSDAVTTQVAAVGRLPMKDTGEIIVTQNQINHSLKQHAKAYEPLKNAKVTITKGQISVSVDAYGTTSTYSGGAKITGGKLEITNPEVSGPAGQILSPDELATIVENQFNSLMIRFHRTPTAISLRTGSISLATKPKAA
ncbi:MAG: zinc ribbon domain-containing protein [Thermomicrobiales bacterium]